MSKSKKEPIERCFWCGKPKSGEIEETEETLSNSVINNYIPCDTCKKSFGDGIHVMGVTTKPIVEGMFPISKNDNDTMLYPTGSMFVATDEFVKELLDGEENKEMLETVLKERKLMIPDEMCNSIVEQARQEQLKNTENSNEENV